MQSYSKDLVAVVAKEKVSFIMVFISKNKKFSGFDVMKSGDARVALIGFPSVGKSTLLSTITKVGFKIYPFLLKLFRV